MSIPGMIFCKYCGKELHQSAPLCPHCGGILHSATVTLGKLREGPHWVSVLGLTFSILSLFGTLGSEGADKDTVLGLSIFIVIGLVCGAIGIRHTGDERKMAIASVILSAMSILILFGRVGAQ